jgi:predicted ribonuclease YlaK
MSYHKIDKRILKWMEEMGFTFDPVKDPYQYAYMCSLLDQAIKIVFCQAKAGTGKTQLAVLAALYALHAEWVQRIVYIRSPQTTGKELGYLEGSLENKQAPYMKPFIQAINCNQSGRYEELVRKGKVIVSTPTYLRGTNNEDEFIILDESQNYDIEEMLTTLTRPHDTCKIAVIGAINQNDNKRNLIKGRTPFEWYAKHFKPDSRTAVHTLKTVYRGWIATHADNIWDTINAEEGTLDEAPVFE